MLERLAGEGLIERRGDHVLLRRAVEAMDPADAALMQAMLALYARTGFGSPRPDELPDALHASPDRCLLYTSDAADE